MNKLTPEQKKLWKRIAQILWEKWDPIGVYEEGSDWNDEYDNYVPHIFRLAIESNDHSRIASSLTATTNQNIGLSAKENNDRDIKVAKLILDAKKEILG